MPGNRQRRQRHLVPSYRVSVAFFGSGKGKAWKRDQKVGICIYQKKSGIGLKGKKGTVNNGSKIQEIFQAMQG